jgi:hypothetical protein
MSLKSLCTELVESTDQVRKQKIVDVMEKLIIEASKIRLVYQNELAKDHLFDMSVMDQAVKELGELNHANLLCPS